MGMAFVPRGGHAKCPSERLEHRLRDMVRIAAVEAVDVHGGARRIDEPLEELPHEVHVEVSDPRAGILHPVMEPGPAGEVEDHAGQRLVEGHAGVSVAENPALVPERFRDRLTEHDAGVLHGVVRVDFEVALRPYLQIDEPVARDLVEHVVEEGHPGGDVGLPGAVEVEDRLDAGLLRIARDGGASMLHGGSRVGPAAPRTPPPGGSLNETTSEPPAGGASRKTDRVTDRTAPPPSEGFRKGSAAVVRAPRFNAREARFVASSAPLSAAGMEQSAPMEYAAHAPARRAGLFVTCLVDLYRPSTGFAAVRLLEAAGCEVEVPEGQTCCGQPAFNSGDVDTARAIARSVIGRFEGFDHVVAPSGSCAGMIRRHLPGLFAGDAKWRERAERLAGRTWELTSFLVDVCGVGGEGRGLDGRDGVQAPRGVRRAAYHDSCSGLRELGVREQPRRLLAGVAGLDLVEMADREACCGFGGTFCVKYPEISGRMVGEKVENVTATGADAVLGGDLGCLLNIAGRLGREGRSVRAFHIAEVLAGTADRGIGEPGPPSTAIRDTPPGRAERPDPVAERWGR